MKSLILIIMLLINTKAYSMEMDAGDLCYAWGEYSTEQAIYNETKKNMKAQGIDIDEIEPGDKRRLQVLKSKFDQQKKKFEKKTRAKFKSNMCQP